MSVPRPRWNNLTPLILIALIVALHVGYFLINYVRGEYSLGVDGPRYRTLALEYLNSDTLLGEKCKTVFWTPWFVIVALLQANRVAVFVFNLTAFAITLYCLMRLSDLLGFPSWGKALSI
ncbi:MAG: hypothetical protein V2A74_04600, partial [bacterium]